MWRVVAVVAVGFCTGCSDLGNPKISDLSVVVHDAVAGDAKGAVRRAGSISFSDGGVRDGAGRVGPDRAGSVELSDLPFDAAARSIWHDLLAQDLIVGEGKYPNVTVSVGNNLSRSEIVDLFRGLALEHGATLAQDGSGRWRLALGVPFGVAVERVTLRHRRAGEFSQFGNLFRGAVGDVAVAAAQSVAAPAVQVLPDERSHSVVVAGPGAVVREVVELIRAADQPILSGQEIRYFEGPEGTDAVLALLVPPSVMIARWSGGVLVSGSPVDVARVAELVVMLGQTGQPLVRRLELHRLSGDDCVALVGQLGRSNSSVGSLGFASGPQVSSLSPVTGSGPIGGLTGERGASSVVSASGADSNGQGNNRAVQPASPLGEPSLRQGDGGGVVVASAGNAACVVRGSARQVGEALEWVRAADQPVQRVELEAVLFEVATADNWRAGLSFGWNDVGASGRGVVGRGAAVADLGRLAASATGGYVSILSWSAQSVLEMAAGAASLRVLSQPTLGLDVGREAVLQVGDQVPIVTQANSGYGAGQLSTQVSYRDVGVILRALVETVDGDLVRLKVVQEVSDAQRTTTSDIDSPTIARRAVSTVVTVPVGQTALIGGLYRGTKDVNRVGLPGLVDIPVLGALFGRDEEATSSRELVLLVTPRVIDERRDVARIKAIVERIGAKV